MYSSVSTVQREENSFKYNCPIGLLMKRILQFYDSHHFLTDESRLSKNWRYFSRFLARLCLRKGSCEFLISAYSLLLLIKKNKYPASIKVYYPPPFLLLEKRSLGLTYPAIVLKCIRTNYVSKTGEDGAGCHLEAHYLRKCHSVTLTSG